MSIGYKGTIADFLTNPDAVCRALTENGANYCVLKTQNKAWIEEIEILKHIFLTVSPQIQEKSIIFFEYEIPRMNKRVDVVLLMDGILFVLEFKISLDSDFKRNSYNHGDCDQVSDYALEFSYFHSESHRCPIVPILIDTGVSKCGNTKLSLQGYNVYDVLQCNSQKSLGDILLSATQEISMDNRLSSYENWDKGDYEPTPTIVEAAEALYANHSVEEITRSGAGTEGIKAATTKINSLIKDARINNKKIICFLTGVPGAGKTLVGINLAATRDESGANRVFLSGNYPLVKVLQEALIRNRKDSIALIQERLKTENNEKLTASQAETLKSVIIDRIKLQFSQEDFKKFQKKLTETPSEQFCSDPTMIIKSCGISDQKKIKSLLPDRRISRKDIEPAVRTKIQLVPNFRIGYDSSMEPPNEHVFVFDEAQRAWSASKVKKEEKREDGRSEPDILLSYLDRHDWCVAIALVGTGQDIHDGEAGIEEWYHTLSKTEFSAWEIYTAEASDSTPFQKMKKSHQQNLYVQEELYLDHPMRSFRARDVSDFIEALLNGRADIAKSKQALSKLSKIINGGTCFPLYITRNIDVAKNKIRGMAKGSERYGVLISSKAKRLRHYGLFSLGQDFDQVAWFLDDKDSIDSSYSMEIAASEFKVQGLEIDYALVGWDGDLKYDAETGTFICRKFGVSTGEWKPIQGKDNEIEDSNTETEKRHLINAYRVILTRARQGMVIFVPTGDISEKDKTIPPEAYDETYNFLKEVGIREIK